jgi:hypothetical protein
MVGVASGYPPQARLAPLVVGIPAAVLAAGQLVRGLSTRDRRVAQPAGESATEASRLVRGSLWFTLFVLVVLAGGLTLGGPVGVFASQRFWLKESWRTSTVSAAVAFLLVHVVLEGQLGIAPFEGWIEAWLRG